ncbi:DUF2189 domain-containing protein [Terrarubrum flagellatum]|uniref:DUF2189 domain-containing protein n=1 Tax=Terrirubrum flagellatum TaxID=2895980 RepID=UPI00314564A1
MANVHGLADGHNMSAQPTIHRIGIDDLRDALRLGYEDFKEIPTHAVFLCLIYPVIGLFLGFASMGGRVTHLVFPLAAGFALIGPFAAIGLYELSRRREDGLPLSWKHAFDIVRSHSFVSILGVGLVLLAIFLGWLVAAQAIYTFTMGTEVDRAPLSLVQFLRDTLTTPQGWMMIIIGNLVGFCFAVLALTVSVVSFPLLIDRDVGVANAIQTSIRAVAENPQTMAIWGLIVAVALALGSIPLFVGLAIVMPILGHATWHLYRKVVSL